MWTLSQVQAEYRRLDRLLGIDTGRVAVSFSKRMTRQYGVCTFVKNKPQEIRLADFLRQEDQVFWDTARHEYAHAAVALLTGKRHGHDEAWKAVCRKIGCPPERLAPNCNAAVENRKRIEAVRGVYVVTCLGLSLIHIFPGDLFHFYQVFRARRSQLLYRRARIAFRTASTITPTSAKMAAHMLATPNATSARQPNFTTSENTMFCRTMPMRCV